LSYESSELISLKPAASQNLLSASEPCNLVADGYAKNSRLLFDINTYILLT